MSPQTIRHLKALEVEELIWYQTLQADGASAHVYQLSRQGRDHLRRTLHRFPDSRNLFAVSLLIPGGNGRYDQMSALQKQWERKASYTAIADWFCARARGEFGGT